MAKIDAYLRSLEKFGARGLVLSSNQSVTLRFPGGDRHATQVTPHDQLVALVREVAPPDALAAVDASRPARFEVTSNGARYTVSVAPRADRWTVQIDPAPAAQPPAEAPAPADDEMLIERTAHDQASRGGSWLDQLIGAARTAGASDLHLVPGTRPMARAGAELVPVGDAAAVDNEQLERELETAMPGILEDHERVHVHVAAGVARCRVHVYRDRHGIGAALRLHPLDPPDPRRLGLPDAALALASRRRGLVLVASPAGAGRTTTIAAMIEHNASRGVRVVSIERALEIVHGHRRGLVSQRVIGEHAPSIAQALAAIADEDAAVIAVHDLPDPASIQAAIDLAQAGRLVIAGVAAATTSDAIERVKAPRLASALAGATAQVLCRRTGPGYAAAFEVLAATDAVLAALRQDQAFQLPSIVEAGRGQGMIALAAALADLARSRAVSVEEALAHAPDPHAVRALLGT
ncbi:MAG TPA: ATPase, T2SS/T4P/T4SS family [Kofleriaceae bacterium]|nr:ATPase, T2SS/T4P/T4SS family [Kofleriaceae bacterium]